MPQEETGPIEECLLRGKQPDVILVMYGDYFKTPDSSLGMPKIPWPQKEISRQMRTDKPITTIKSKEVAFSEEGNPEVLLEVHLEHFLKPYQAKDYGLIRDVRVKFKGRIVRIEPAKYQQNQYLVDTEIYLPQTEESEGREFILRLNESSVGSKKLPPRLRLSLERRREENFREYLRYRINTEVSQQMQGEKWVSLNDDKGDVERGNEVEDVKTKKAVVEILKAHVPQTIAVYCLGITEIPPEDYDEFIDDFESLGESLIDRTPVIIQQGDKRIVDLLVEVPKQDPLEIERHKLLARLPEASEYEIARFKFAHRPDPVELIYPELDLDKVVDDFYG